jgi:hypothetical protein
MSLSVLKAYWKLICFDARISGGNFSTLYEKVRSCRHTNRTSDPAAIDSVCSAVDMACIWYWKEVHCLQRSAATACLLREHGVSAQMVIGSQHRPLKAHAWVEVEGRVVNDKPYMAEMYSVLDRC